MKSHVVIASAVLAAAVPLAYWQYRRYIELKKRREALKLLRKVELIAAEVAIRLTHLETQVKELVEYEATKEAGETEDKDPTVTYYHLDSKGNKLTAKWDAYNVDAELERLENDEQGDEVLTAATGAPKIVRKTPLITRLKAFATSQGIEHEFEAVLSFLDDVRGNEEVKQLRKAIANKVTTDYYPRIDAIQAMLA